MSSSPSSTFSAPDTPPDLPEDSMPNPAPATTGPPKPPNNTSNTKKATSVDCYSMNLDAFILNKHIFNEEHFIAPLSRPDNSAFLPGPFSVPDAIPFVDIDGAYPWYRNSRISDVTKAPKVKGDYDELLRKERLGVYLHWCLPQYFRSGNTEDTEDAKLAGKITHKSVPDRWIVFRCITEASDLDPPALTPFIVESNRIRHFGGHIDPSANDDFDVEVETSPFIDPRLPVERQVDVFMGMKRRFDDDWDDPDPEGTYHTPLTLLDSANPLFADFQHHNSSIFSIHDDVTWTDSAGKIIRPSWATISYAVFGYHSQHDQGKTICHGSLYNVEWTRDRAPKISEALEIAKTFSTNQPVALGADALEALETYLHSLRNDLDWVGLIDEMKTSISQGGQGGMLDSHIPQNLRAGFKPTDGGRCWRFNNDAMHPDEKQTGDKKTKTDTHIPTPTEMRNMLEVDRFQSYTDAIERQEAYLRHRLFCEWWKLRSKIPGGRGSEPKCEMESKFRVKDALETLDALKKLQSIYTQKRVPADQKKMHPTARPEFFSRAAPSFVLGGLGTAWPSEFLVKEDNKPRSLDSLPFSGSEGSKLVADWLKGLTGGDASISDKLCMTHGMKHFFQNPDLVERIPVAVRQKNKVLMWLTALFKSLDGLRALTFNAPGWVRVTVDTLMEEWAYAMSIGDPETKLRSPKPAYYSLADTHWNSTQPFRALFLEWELEYYHLPKRFWMLEKSSDGTADYRIAPGVNISSYDLMDYHKRTINGRSILRPNAEWPMTTLLQQLLDKVHREDMKGKTNLEKFANKSDIQSQLEKALKGLNLMSGNLDGLTDHLLTLHQGLHVSPHDSTDPNRGEQERLLLAALLESGDGHDVTPYGEEVYSMIMAERDFKPVTHGQARFTKFNIVDKFGQVISPIHKPNAAKTEPLYPCLGRSIACQLNEAEGGEFANSVELDKEKCSQFFQLGHRINQDARFNSYFAVNSADHKSYHQSTQYFTGNRNLQRGQLEHIWRPITEYEDPVWGWLMLDFSSMGIQVYNAEGESMGEVLVPDSIHSKTYWQVYYAEGDLSEGANENSQLQQLIRRMSDSKFLIGLWSMLADACQNIYHDPMSGDSQMLNIVGRPLALVNIGMNVELATPVMQTQSYQDLLKSEEITLDEYKFEVLLGDKTNLHDGLIGYFPTGPSSTDLISEKRSDAASSSDPTSDKCLDASVEMRPDASCIYTDYGYPGRNIVDGENQKPDSFASPSSSKVYVSPFYVNPAKFKTHVAYDRAINNHPSTVILGAIIDPYMPIHLATGILPSTTLKLPQWIIDKSLKNMRMLLRGGPILTRGDLPDVDIGADSWLPPLNQTKAEACLPALTDKGEWSWLQPTLSTHAQIGHDDEKFDDYARNGEDAYLPKFVPYNLRASPSDYPLQMGPHTVVEGFYKYDMFEMDSNAKLLPGKPVDKA